MPDIDDVEAQQRGQEPDIGFRDLVSTEVAALREAGVEKIQGLEQRADRFLVGLLRGCEARLVDPIVDRVVDARIQRVDFVRAAAAG